MAEEEAKSDGGGELAKRSSVKVTFPLPGWMATFSDLVTLFNILRSAFFFC